MEKKFETMSDSEGKFSFGINWTDFAKNKVDENIVSTHVNDALGHLLRMPGFLSAKPLEGKRVIDIGCGSGLSSLSFYENGCRDITSFDVNEDSIKATNIIKERFCNDESNLKWSIKEGSILDENLVSDLRSQEKYDLVYSWGVLHHTGDMRKAIDNTLSLCQSGSILWMALYIKVDQPDGEEIYQNDLKLKIKFNEASEETKKEMIVSRLKKVFGNNPATWTRPYDNRGMTPINDVTDWLGGYPYEVARAKDIKRLLEANGFSEIEVLNENRASGTNVIYIYQKI